MIIQKLKDTDVLTGEEVTRKYYFHLSKADAIKILVKYTGRDASKDADLEKALKEIITSGDNEKAMNVIEYIIKQSIGYRTSDGRFAKSVEYADAFIASEAYGELFVKVLTDANFTEHFFGGLVNTVKRPQQKPQGNKKKKLHSLNQNENN